MRCSSFLKINYFLANHAQLTCACFPNIIVSESSQITYSVVKQPFTAYSGKVTIIYCPLGLSMANVQKTLMNRSQVVMEARGFEPLTSGLQSPRSAN